MTSTFWPLHRVAMRSQRGPENLFREWRLPINCHCPMPCKDSAGRRNVAKLGHYIACTRHTALILATARIIDFKLSCIYRALFTIPILTTGNFPSVAAPTRTTTRSCRDPETSVICGRQVASAAGRSVSRRPAAAGGGCCFCRRRFSCWCCWCRCISKWVI